MPALTHASVVSCLLLLGACAGGVEKPLSDDQRLAQAGLQATTVFAEDVTGVSRQLAEGDALTAFSTTWKNCAAQGSCTIALPSDEAQQQRAELERIVALRLGALAGLQRAYEAFGADADRKPGEAAQATVRGAVAGSWSYATALIGLNLGSASGISEPFEQSVGYLASLGASRRERGRMASASGDLAAAIRTLRESLALETRLYDALAEGLVREKIEVHRALLQAGLVSGAETLRPIVLGLRLNLNRDADYVLARSPQARMAVEAALEASERAEVRRTQMRYRALIQALGELETVHEQLAKREAVDLRRLDAAMARVQSLSAPPPTPPSQSTYGSPFQTTSGPGAGTTLRQILESRR